MAFSSRWQKKKKFIGSLSPCTGFFLIGKEGAERSAAGTRGCAPDAQLQTLPAKYFLERERKEGRAVGPTHQIGPSQLRARAPV